MDYPQDFPAESRARVEAARIRAGRQFDSKKAKARWRSEIEALFWTYVLTPFLVFARESSLLRLWPVDKMDQNSREFLRRLTIDAYYEKGKAAGLSDVIDNISCGIRWEDLQEIEKTSQWRSYESIRFKLAESSSVQNNGKTTQSAESKSTTAERQTQARPIDRGKFCDGVIDEIKRIRNLAVGTGRSVAEIEKENPDFAVWKVRSSLSPEDQETFNHPNQWGAPVGYAKIILSKTHDVSTHTIDSWVKAYRKDLQAKKA